MARVAAEHAPENVKVQFVVVYIAEAHAIDEWPISSSRYTQEEVSIPQTRILEERIEIAKYALTKVGYIHETDSPPPDDPEWILLVAPPEEEQSTMDPSVSHFESEYKPWPFRAWGFVDSKIDLVAEPHACEVKIEELRDWLGKHIPLS